jgi:hypothetical protein
VLDLGASYGSFINSVVAKRRIAIDIRPDFARFLDPRVEAMVGSINNLDFLADKAVDFAFASNVFEHIRQPEFSLVLENLRSKLSWRGTLNILQPNYRYAYREYFDDYTHKSIYSDVSLGDFLKAHSYDILEINPRFMPLTIKSWMPISPFLIHIYLVSPIKLFGKQMLVRAKPR